MKNSLNARKSDLSEAIKTVAKSTELRLAYVDRDFKYIWVNPSYARGAGYETQQLIGKNHFDLFPDEDHRLLLKKVIETGQRAELSDTLFELPSQQEHVVTYWDVVANPVRDAEDKVSGLVLTVLETTGRKKMEELLKKSEGKCRAFIQNSPDGIIVINTEGTVTEWNEGEERITGIPRSAALGRPLWDIQYQLAPEERRTPTFCQMAREKILSGIRERTNLTRVIEEEIQRPDGSRRIIESTVFVNQYQGEIQAGGIVRDITERKWAERELNERMKELHCIYSIAEIAERPGITLDEIYQEVVNLLPGACQYPEIICARIIINGKELKTKNYRESKWKHSSDIKIGGAKVGYVELSCLEERLDIWSEPLRLDTMG